MHNHHNGLKTAALFGVLWAVLLGLGAVIGSSMRSTTPIWIMALVGVGTTAYGYWNSDKLALRSMQAYPVTEEQAPQLYQIVRELSAKANQPMPRIYVSPTPAPNAFATGRNPQNAAVCCTEGILRLLSLRELRGVLGHELMHVYNRDILTSSVAAAVAGVITSVGQMLLIFGGGDRRNSNPLAVMAMALLAPLAAVVIQSAISRTREYDADEDGSALTGDPLALASALRKIHQGVQMVPLPPDQKLVNTSHLMIANPFRAGGVTRMFATHPPMQDRITRLELMAGGPAS
ncbi:heat shock protein HtpX [Arthrobacter sp. PvP102]|uniref:Protease HtpX homolog n=1 Tax=Arthrobacter sp. (strain FB24) TaxID=290399 RepID=HTPX_ARTS2|nr:MULTISPECIES: zinc metalloprotease HtpX [unclassified Arthrobacter]A0JZI3.1 RecName: Full=Protease HtpX homolog [Arthrobacter sp. FB24]ABK04453.1 Heat shock protein, Metallo peptidase, MEROPS family M48B [Arthrobacter sp. FB24]MBP1232392.1 heat shock protein HtpX [Arthrobacter sp. PvP103]MBP1237527.1 heat shock protein HtpX [Arthrobacter sp. PvP102]